MKKFSYENYIRRDILNELINLYNSIKDTGLEDKTLEKVIMTRVQQIFDTEEFQKIKLSGDASPLCYTLGKKKINGRHIIRAKIIHGYYCLPNGDIYSRSKYIMSIKPYSTEEVIVNSIDVKKKKENKIKAIKAKRSKDKTEEEIDNKFFGTLYTANTYLYVRHFVNRTVGKKKDFTKGRYFDAIPEPYKLLERICLTLEQTKDASIVSDLLKDELYTREKWKGCYFHQSRINVLIDLLHACGVRPGHYVYYKRDKIIDKNPYNEIDFLESHSKVNVFRPKIIDKNSTIGHSDEDIGRIYIDMEETEENKKMEYCKGPISHNSLYGDANIVEIADAYSLFKKIMDKEENKDQKEFYQSIKVLPPNEELKKEENKK